MKKLLLFFFIINCPFSIVRSFAQNLNFSFNGHNRSCIIHLPPSYNDSVDYPLVFNLHGYGSNASQQQLYAKMNSVADTANFIVAYPNAVNSIWDTLFSGSSINDVGYINALLDSIMANYSINEHRIYSCGMSMGGFMTYRLAGELSGRLAAIASVAGPATDSVLYFCNSALMMPVMHIHGTADGTIPYTGQGIYLDIDSTVNYFVERNNCNSTPDSVQFTDINTSDNSTVTSFCYSCNDSNEVLFYKVYGAEHSWPGALIPLGVTNYDISASAEIWKFFSRHQRENISLLDVAENENDFDLKVYPNPTSSLLTLDCGLRVLYCELKITNALGQLVHQSAITNPKSAIDVSPLNPGIYYLYLQGTNEKATRKFVKL